MQGGLGTAAPFAVRTRLDSAVCQLVYALPRRLVPPPAPNPESLTSLHVCSFKAFRRLGTVNAYDVSSHAHTAWLQTIG